jgi:autotransporter translocation and assembly factor TamB
MRDKTRAQGSGRIDISGTAQAPVVHGSVEVANGRIMIPETPKELIALDSKALLWDRESLAAASPEGPSAQNLEPEEKQALERSSGMTQPASTALAQADSTTAKTGRTTGNPTPSQSQAMRQMDLSVKVKIPAGVWLEGRGLNVELTGDVEVVQKNGVPVLTGTLHAHQGKMQFQGRGMDIDEGTVTFYGGDEVNPSLNLMLVKRQSDVTVRAHITGTVMNPALELESDPEMSQSDIFAFLLFGKRSDNLTNEQNESLQSRALATAEQFAATRLTDRLSSELGLDLLSFQQSQGDSAGHAVTVGKYLSPNLLVKYEQTLEQETGFDIVVQYWIGNGFNLETRGSRYKQSGATLNWGQDF